MSSLSPISRPGILPERDLEFTSHDFSEIAVYLHERTGIRLNKGNEPLVFSRLSKRLRQLGISRFSDYIEMVRAPENTEERESMISALTTNTTRFFREPYHFDTFRDELLPGLVEQARRGSRIRIWSAGCSTGEEPYSIAICLAEAFPIAKDHDIKILATDIDKKVLARAATGRYPASAIEPLPPARRNGCFQPVSDTEVEVKPEIRSLITFRFLNLIEPWPVRGPFQVIFCRNVTIYMEEDTQLGIWRNFDEVLDEDATIFIGHSERLAPELKDRFDLTGKTTYRHNTSGTANEMDGPGAKPRGSEQWH